MYSAFWIRREVSLLQSQKRIPQHEVSLQISNSKGLNRISDFPWTTDT